MIGLESLRRYALTFSLCLAWGGKRKGKNQPCCVHPLAYRLPLHQERPPEAYESSSLITAMSMEFACESSILWRDQFAAHHAIPCIEPDLRGWLRPKDPPHRGAVKIRAKNNTEFYSFTRVKNPPIILFLMARLWIPFAEPVFCSPN